METNFAPLIYRVILIMAVSQALASFIDKPRLHNLILKLKTLACAVAIALVWGAAGRLPLFGPFEAMVLILFVTGVLAQVFTRKSLSDILFSRINSLVTLGILALIWFQPMTLNPNYYMYENIWVFLFFFLRLVAVAVLVHGTVQFLCLAWSGENKDGIDGFYFQGGRNTLLIGICTYLTSEWAGSLWCLNWLGDSWQWSQGFFKASLVFLLVMMACHLPGQMVKRPVVKGVIGSIPGIFGIYMVFFH